MNPMNRNCFPLAGALALIFLQATSLTQAQTAPQSGDLLRQVRPPELPPAAPAPLPGIGDAPLAPAAPAQPGAATIEVSAFRIDGNRAIDGAELSALLQGEGGGKRYTLAALEELALRLTRYYRARGYFVARVYLPAQELDGGIVTLRVVEGRYGQFRLDNQSLVRDDVIQGLLDDARRGEGEVVSLDTLERAMLNINDTPGVQVSRADVLPGEQVGTSDFAVATGAGSRVNGYLMLDNYGSVYTGKTRLAGNLDWNSPSGRGDRLSVGGMLSDGGGLYNGRLAYSALMAANGTRAEFALARTRYDLGDRYAVLGATGTADSIELGVTTPFKLTRASRIEGGLLLAARHLRDEVSAATTVTGKHSYSVTGSLRARREALVMGYQGLGIAELSVTGGYLKFDDAASRALDASGADTGGSYWKLNAGLSQTVLLPNQFSLSGKLRGQIALNHRNLDGSERMSVSGLSAVVGYPIGELSGDHAALARIELSKVLGMAAGAQWTAGLFTDYGWARATRVQDGVGAARSLGDVGLAVSAETVGGGFARLQIARRTHGGAPSSEAFPSTVVRLQAGWIF